MNTAPINVFQKLMRKWEAVHPYNAAQVMKISGTPDRVALESAWRAALDTAGLGRLHISDNRYGFQPLNGTTGACVNHCAGPLTEYISAEMNRPFAETAPTPLRPFVIAEGDYYFAGVVYQHWVADSVSVRTLLKDWFVRVYDPAAARKQAMRLPASGYWNSIGPKSGGWRIAESFLGLARRHTRLRRVQKIESTALSNHRTEFQLFPAPTGLIGQLKNVARQRGVKLNDIFLAAMAEACSLHVPLQRRGQRTDLAVGSIVDLRPFCPSDLSETFGLFLGFTNVVCRPEDLRDFDRLLQNVSRQTRLQKTTGVAPASLMWMGAAMAIGQLSRPEELYHFYRKELPLAGGISNVDLSKGWMAKYYPSPLLQYVRVSPTGPMTPLVLTTTTLGETFHVGLTHRVGLLSKSVAEEIAAGFLARLGNLT
jgi:Condensation domain